ADLNQVTLVDGHRRMDDLPGRGAVEHIGPGLDSAAWPHSGLAHPQRSGQKRDLAQRDPAGAGFTDVPLPGAYRPGGSCAEVVVDDARVESQRAETGLQLADIRAVGYP